jgi:hypothetical protein
MSSWERHIKLYREREANGLCRFCGEPSPAGVRCASCREKNNSWRKKNRERLKNNGQCFECKNTVVRNKKLCEFCSARVRENKERRKAAGFCIDCGGQPLVTKNNCAECKLRKNERSKVLRDITKKETVAAYGGKCVCCGEDNWGFLTIDHPNNDGAEHRRQLGISGGIAFYMWLRRNNYPKDFQILCWNCNCGKRDNGGICPHKAAS